ncbi:MAG TPA: class I SAM-dependent methyltransferase [Pyrinomonadaceae bacterium]|nr:class I SAM-dependent methyltransferase [Pyrinomonadaceae bacterium]
MDQILNAFPKTRKPLPSEYQEIYAEHYKQNREGDSKAAGAAQFLEGWMHRKVAHDARAGRSTLEIGAGTLNHLPYEPDSRPYDVIEPFEMLYKSSPNVALVRNFYDDIEAIPEGARYDRIISIAAFEHICDLPRVVARCGLLLSDGGRLNIGIPSEGTILWRLGYQLTTGLEFRRKYNLDYSVMMRHEHVNTAREIEYVVEHFFASIRSSVFGIARALSLYQFHRCEQPRLYRCREFLAETT